MKLSKKALKALQAGKPMPLSEAGFQKQVVAFAKMHGWHVAHFRTVRVQRRSGAVYHETPVGVDGKGFPDLLMIRGCRVIVAELKVPPNTVSAEQTEWLLKFGGAGAEAFVWRPADWDVIEKTLRL